MNHLIILVSCCLFAAACTSRPASGITHPAETASTEPVSRAILTDETSSPQDSEEAYRDSISMITGIAPESPYWYDPSWGITYSSKMDSLLYYPRERKDAYFTIPSSVWLIDDRAFQCNHHLKEIIIPEGVIKVGTGAFLSSKKLRIVTIRGCIEELPWRAFDDCQKLASVELPWSLTSIGGLAFGGCERLRRIVIRNPEPPKLEGCEPGEDIDETWPFAGVDTDRCVLQVPFGSVKKYREAPGWSRFRHIEGNIKPIPHRWVELDSTLLAGYGIAPGDIERWKQYFDRKFRFNTLDADQIRYYQSENHFVTVNDLSALLFDQGNDSIPKQNCTLWRLLQYASQRGIRFPFNPDQLPRVLRTQIDSVLSYGAWSTIDMSTQAALEETLRAWYNDLVLSRIKAVSSAELRSCLEKEEEAWKAYHDKAMTAYERLNDNTGSISFAYFCNFGSMDQRMRHLGVEEYYSAVFAGVSFPRLPGAGRHGIVTNTAVSQAYQEFRKDVPDWSESEPLPAGLYPQREMRAALTTEQRSWEAWMAVRAVVSDLLSGKEKAAWDNATNNIRRYKRIMLKNRYEDPDGESGKDLLKFD